MAALRSVLVAAITRVSACSALVEPRVVLAIVENAQQLTCRLTSISEISSNRSVPPFASAKWPGLSCRAPVNAPFT